MKNMSSDLTITVRRVILYIFLVIKYYHALKSYKFFSIIISEF